MRDPSLIPDSTSRPSSATSDCGISIHSTCFRITWHNEPTPSGGGFGGVNFIEVPSELTGVSARIIMLEGKWFPTGRHKVGAAFGCLVPRLVTGQFDPTTQKAVWPSTGNYCRGGAYDSNLLGLRVHRHPPRGHERRAVRVAGERAGEIIKTPGTESNVKEIFDKCNELRASGEDLVIFNQFDEFGNYLWHYSVTGPAMVEVLEEVMGPNDSFRGVTLTTGSAGTIGSGDYLKQVYPTSKIAAGEAGAVPDDALQRVRRAPHRGHRRQAHPVDPQREEHRHGNRLDDEAVISLIRLFNEPAGIEYLAIRASSRLIEQAPLLGISGVGNMLSAIKFAKYYELTGRTTSS